MMLDTLVTNANIVSVDATHARGSSIGIWNGYVVGLDDDVVDTPARHVVDARGATILPGFCDAHCHTTSFGLGFDLLDLTYSSSVGEILAAVAERAASLKVGEWVIGVGYGHGLAAGQHPSMNELEGVALGHPVWLTHRSGHLCVVNHTAVRLIEDRGVLRSPDRGRVHLDDDGRPNGVLEDAAMDLVKNYHGPSSIDQLARAIDLATRQYAAEGITSFTDAGIGCPGIDHSPLEIAAYQHARDTGRLHARAQLMVHSEMLHGYDAHPRDTVTLGLDFGIRTGIGDSWLEVGAVKVWVDGSGSAGSVATSDDDRVDVFDNDPATLTRVITEASRSGWQVACHAMGDRALDLVLDALEAASDASPLSAGGSGLRHRIEHGGLIRSDQVDRLAHLGAVVVPQPVFISEFGDTLAATLCGRVDTGKSFRVRSLLDAGVHVAGSSDRPVAPGSPLRGIQSMVERLTATGDLYEADERVPVETAIACYTRGGAYASHNEHRRGSLTPGLEADLVVLAENPTEVDVSTIADINVVATVVGGVATFDPLGMFESVASGESASRGRA